MQGGGHPDAHPVARNDLHEGGHPGGSAGAGSENRRSVVSGANCGCTEWHRADQPLKELLFAQEYVEIVEQCMNDFETVRRIRADQIGNLLFHVGRTQGAKVRAPWKEPLLARMRLAIHREKNVEKTCQERGSPMIDADRILPLDCRL